MTIQPLTTHHRRMPIDNLLFAMVICLIAVGMCMVFNTGYFKISTTTFRENPLAVFGNVIQQFKGVIGGFIAMWAVMKMGYWRLRKIAVPLMFLGGFMLLLVWFPHIGIEKNNANRWVSLGMMFQPSEIAKLTLIVYLAALLSRPNCKVQEFTDRGLIPPLVVTGIYCLLIEREPDLGTAVVLFFTAITILFLAGARLKHLAAVTAACVLFAMVIGMRHGNVGHRSQRMVGYWNPDADPKGVTLQVHHARYAVGSGQFWGMGWGQGREKLYLPQSDSDFIFCTIAEELGLLRVLPIVTLYLVLAWRGFMISARTKDRFGALLASGVSALIAWQAMMNIGVATTLIPATGVPLPFISMGATSLMTLMAGIGILLSVSQYSTPPVPQDRR